MLQILFDLAKDKIANVRMNSSKSLKMCYSRLAEKDKVFFIKISFFFLFINLTGKRENSFNKIKQ